MLNDVGGRELLLSQYGLRKVPGYHVFRIGEAFMETWNGAEYSTGIADNLPDDSMQTGDDIARYGAKVWKQYESWWAGMPDHTLSRTLKTYYGDTEAHKVFERVTWHKRADP